MMLVSGVRSSWLMLARNSDLALAAASAASRAAISSSSNARRSVTSRSCETSSIGRLFSSRISEGLPSTQTHDPSLAIIRYSRSARVEPIPLTRSARMRARRGISSEWVNS